MEFQNVFTDLRKKAGLSQNDAADRLFVTRQAVSRWERGETVPESETLLAISKLFGVSINTLLGSPRTLVCQSCGMPQSDDYLAREVDGSFHEKYCKWCWVDGAFAQECTMEEMVEHCVPLMPLGQTEPSAAGITCGGCCPPWSGGSRSEKARSLFLQKLLDSSCSFHLFVG